MKKNLFNSFLMMTLVVLFTFSFTACGGDDSNEPSKTPTEEEIGGTTGYVIPCLDFGCSIDHVTNYMANMPGMTASEYNNEYSQSYINDKNTATVGYMFMNNKLHMVTATYIDSSIGEIALKNEIEKAHGTTLTKITDGNEYGEYGYSGNTIVNGKTVVILMNVMDGGYVIIYALPD